MIDNTRHYEIFSLENFMEPEHAIDIIGVGATGSKVAVELLKLGLVGERVRVWDDDIVEEHNVANQAFSVWDKYKSKVVALQKSIINLTGERICVKNERVTNKTNEGLHPYVFLLTDSMQSRKDIWDSKIKENSSINMMIDTRMGIDCMMVYTIDPNNKDDVRFYEGTLYEDDDNSTPEVSACGTSITVGPTATILAGIAVWQFMVVAKAGKRLSTSVPKRQIIMTTNPFNVY